MSREIISTKDAPGAVGPYSQAVLSDGWLYVSGQIPLNPVTGEMVGGDIQAKTQQVMMNLRTILQEAGAGFGDVVKVNVYILDMADFNQVNQVYSEFFKDDPPARACVAVRSLPKGADVEIDLVARIS
jgi:2-iminobutanoate/2-iminopropanoate deaminase